MFFPFHITRRLKYASPTDKAIPTESSGATNFIPLTQITGTNTNSDIILRIFLTTLHTNRLLLHSTSKSLALPDVLSQALNHPLGSSKTFINQNYNPSQQQTQTHHTTCRTIKKTQFRSITASFGRLFPSSRHRTRARRWGSVPGTATGTVPGTVRLRGRSCNERHGEGWGGGHPRELLATIARTRSSKRFDV